MRHARLVLTYLLLALVAAVGLVSCARMFR